MSKQPAIPIQGNVPRITFFMKTPTKTWAETHWYVQPGAGIQTALSAASPLAVIRSSALCGNGSMIEVRASLENVYRDSLVDSNIANFPPTGFPPDNLGNDCLDVRCESTSLYRKTLYLGGIPDDAITGGAYVPGANLQFDKALRMYLVNLAGSANVPNILWGFLAVNKNPAQCPRVPVAKINVAVNASLATITTSQPHLIPVGACVIRLFSVPNATAGTPWNQLWNATAVDGTNVTITLPAPLALGLTQGPGGFLQNQIRVPVPYTSAQVRGAGTRRRGQRAFLPLGRFKRRLTVGY